MKTAGKSTEGSPHKVRLARAIVSVLRPLIQILIRHEFTHSELSELIRQTYVEIAYDQFALPEQGISISRAAVLTGLSRKEVVRLRDALDENKSLLKQKPNRAQRVVHGWLSDPEFLDGKGKPKRLPIKSQRKGKEHGSFVALVKRYSGDITYGAVLDELNLVGVTSENDDYTVSLINSAYVPRKDELEQVRVVATSVSDLFETAVHNMDANDDDKRFQRQVVYTDIDAEYEQEFRQFAAKKAEPFIQELNARLIQYRKKSKGTKKSDQRRMGVGVYYFEGLPVKSKRDPKPD